MFEVKQSSKIKVNIYGSEYEISKPTVRDAEMLSDLSSGQDDKQRIDSTIGFLEKKGLPAEVSKGMEIEHFKAMVEYIFGAVKKN